MTAPRFTVLALDLFERPVRFAKPFRFGAISLTAAPQAFVRATIEVEGFGRATGGSAEMMVPRWFDKRPQVSPDATVDELRVALRQARDIYLNGRSRTAFGHHAAHGPAQVAACRSVDMPDLAAKYGPALIDKALLDALLRACGLPFAEGMRRNLAGIDVSRLPDLPQSSLETFLASRHMSAAIDIRHTVGMDDDLDALTTEVRERALRWFKIKLSGDADRDIRRLRAIAPVLDETAASGVTLDANEQYAELAALTALCNALSRDPLLLPIASRLLFIEQPLPRERTWDVPLGALGDRFAFIIDEADDAIDCFPRARKLGYRGVSSKSCKGLYKSLINAARAKHWGDSFVSAEDLTCQAGLAVQQDSMLAAFVGATHVERNGHHYVDGFAGASRAEADAFLAAHPDLYERHDGVVRLRTDGGTLSLRSLDAPGFAAGAMPDWHSLTPLAQPALQEFAHA